MHTRESISTAGGHPNCMHQALNSLQFPLFKKHIGGVFAHFKLLALFKKLCSPSFTACTISPFFRQSIVIFPPGLLHTSSGRRRKIVMQVEKKRFCQAVTQLQIVPTFLRKFPPIISFAIPQK